MDAAGVGCGLGPCARRSLRRRSRHTCWPTALCGHRGGVLGRRLRGGLLRGTGLRTGAHSPPALAAVAGARPAVGLGWPRNGQPLGALRRRTGAACDLALGACADARSALAGGDLSRRGAGRRRVRTNSIWCLAAYRRRARFADDAGGTQRHRTLTRAGSRHSHRHPWSPRPLQRHRRAGAAPWCRASHRPPASTRGRGLAR